MTRKFTLFRIALVVVFFSGLLKSAALAQSTDPAHFDDHLKTAQVLFQQDKTAEAFAEIQAAGKADPTRYEAPALAAILLLKGGHAAEARTALAEARKLAPAEKQARLDSIERLIDAAAPSSNAPPANPVATVTPLPTAPPSGPSAAQRREYNVLMLIMGDADKAASLPERQKFLGEFLQKSSEYTQEFPDDGRVWLLRALTCVELGQENEGILAAREIERLGLTSSEDPKVQRLVATLDRKGWFKARTLAETNAEKERAFAQKRQELDDAGVPKKIVIPKLGTVLIRIDPGTFSMGSPKEEAGHFDNEVQHEVAITKAYWLGQYDVTQDEYKAVMGARPSEFKRAGGRAPVENVSYDEALAFCQKLTEQERAAGRLMPGYMYTLPTEAQWEYACRAGTTGAYAGNLDAMAWYDQNSGQTTHPVGQKQANPWGLYDMHGNVWQWCLDWYGDYTAEAQSDPTGAPSGADRVYRGGGWDDSARRCRSAGRGGNVPGLRDFDLGFRLALSSVP